MRRSRTGLSTDYLIASVVPARRSPVKGLILDTNDRVVLFDPIERHFQLRSAAAAAPARKWRRFWMIGMGSSSMEKTQRAS